ncbi:MAG TPA: metallophosphoesterase, partial [Actinomycetota bacterium]|nr:metallophosphoesterase [Actinomycetota bacterium]
MRRRFPLVLASLVLSVAALLGAAQPGTTLSSSLTRAPYLTDLVKRHVTVNWATTTAITRGHVAYGQEGVEACDAHRTTATPIAITVGLVTETQWSADLNNLLHDTVYCYSIYGGPQNLLGTDTPPAFLSQLAHGSTVALTFAVFGDWGQVDATGADPDQANLLAHVAASGARFAVTTGDTGYPDGSQKNYGDLLQTGSGTSAVFGPSFWPVPGASIPMFNGQGNHGESNAALINWPERHAVRSSGGRYEMETQCCQNQTTSASYPSEWYAFNAGPVRLYVLDASWDNGNVGNSSIYGNDYDAHWALGAAERTWLENDLQRHPAQISFAFFHFPLYTSNATETTDSFLDGPSSLEGVLGQGGVDIVFNGHAHIYERNAPSAAGMPVSYVTGGGGATLEPVSVCGAPDLFALGWSGSSPGSACGGATKPIDSDQVFH